MNRITTPIIPTKQTFTKVHAPHELDLEAICVFASTGFFLDTDTYWKDLKVLPAGSISDLDENGFLKTTRPWFKWNHTPKSITFEEAVNEFSDLFKTIVSEQVGGSKVILPLSGGLDSRTQAIALKQLGVDVQSYSYQFANGYNETKIAAQVAKICSFDFQKFVIPKGYLWESIDDLADINKCYSDFCSPRQMAVIEPLKQMTGIFSLGHWGDVLFDDMQVPEHLSLNEQTEVVIKKITKRGGITFAEHLWQVWDLSGVFYDYLFERIKGLLKQIDITQNANSQIRAFKSLYWAPRWTSVNLSVFEAVHPISLPYYDDRMCEFICTLPESYLAGRRLQIAYIKKNSPELARLTWDFYHPFNLYDYQKYQTNRGFGQRLLNSLTYRAKLALGATVIQRNWELQFLGASNDKALRGYLFSDAFYNLIPKAVIEEFYQAFKTKESLNYAHAINMLLTLSQWYSKFNSDKDGHGI